MCVCLSVDGWCLHGDGHVIVSERRLKGLDLFWATFMDIRIIEQNILYGMYICVCGCVCMCTCVLMNAIW